jgi:tetratricopeptide (TPR) repeat protein
MNRTLLLKLLYLAAVLVLAAVALVIITTAFRGRESFGAILVILLLLVPGRFQGMFFRNLFRGRRLLDSGHPKEALPHLQAFLAQLKESPWKKKLIWLAWSVYTPDADAMAWNNIGAAHTNLGNWEEAKAAFGKALAIDEKYPLPHLNLARIAIVQGDGANAEHHLDSAKKLGYRATSIDQLIHQTQATLARVEGRGSAATNTGS